MNLELIEHRFTTSSVGDAKHHGTMLSGFQSKNHDERTQEREEKNLQSLPKWGWPSRTLTSHASHPFLTTWHCKWYVSCLTLWDMALKNSFGKWIALWDTTFENWYVNRLHRLHCFHGLRCLHRSTFWCGQARSTAHPIQLSSRLSCLWGRHSASWNLSRQKAKGNGEEDHQPKYF